MIRLIILSILLFPLTSLAQQSLTIGIFAYRPKAVLEARWQPIVHYLEQRLTDTDVKLRILNVDELEASIRRNELDFIFTNPRHFITLRLQFPLSGAIATLIAKQHNTQTSQLGGVFITRPERTDINQLLDLKNKSVAACGLNHLGGYQSQIYELAQQGIDFKNNIKLRFMGTPHDKIVHAVLTGDVDAGFIRTGTIEQMQQEGKLDAKQLKIINQQDFPSYPYIVSTRLYPEWPFVVMPKVDSHIANKVASALLNLDGNHPVSQSIGIHGFTVPADYLPVEKVMRELRLPPFDAAPAFTLKDIWKQHKTILTPLFIATLVVIVLLFILINRNRQLVLAGRKIKEAEQRQKNLLNHSPAVIYIMDLQGRYLFINRCIEDLLNTTNEEIQGKTDYDIFPLEYADTLRANDKKVLETGAAIELEETAWLEDGEHIYLSTKFPLKDVSGKIYATCGMSTDITERKLAEKQISKFKHIIDNSLNEIYLFDCASLHFVYVNQGAQKNMGYSLEEFKKLTPTDIKPELSASEFNLLTEPLTSRREDKIEFKTVHQRKDGSLYPVEIHLQLTNDSHPVFVAIILDISARQQAEEKLIASESLQKQILQTVPDLIWLKDRDGHYLMSNPQFELFINKTEPEIIGKTDYDFFDQETADVFREHDKIAEAANQPSSNEERLTFANDGRSRLFETIKIPMRDDSGETIGILGVARDITERKLAEEQSRLAASVFETTREGILITNFENQIIDANPACCKITGYSKAELLGENPSKLSANIQAAEIYKNLWTSLSEAGYWQGDLWNRHKNGEVYAERISISKVEDELGKLTHYVGVFSDVTYIKEHEAELEKIAHNDALTGLPNRLLLRDRMSQAFSQTTRHKKLIAICYLDLDGFKPVNDEYGHKAGDLVLVEIAKRLLQGVRTGDTVSRLGGDEFVLLMLDIENKEELESIIQRIIQKIASPIELPDCIVSVSASMGITLYPHDDNEADILLRHADQAMFEAKEKGKNCFVFFDPEHKQKQTETQILYREIAIALQEDQFQLYYQPKVNMRTDSIIGAEALIRWQHPVKGLLSPVFFLPMIENHPLIIEVGDWVLKQALTQLQLWKEQGITLVISVNVAALQLQQLNFISKLKSLLANYPQIQASQLELEILETAALDDLQKVNKVLNECKQLGINVAIDDFGTGYSSLTYLKHLSVETIKIDQSFIRDILVDQNDMAIVEGILQLAKSFNRKPLAEGVESNEHASLLLMIGCEVGQGYAIARPMPAKQIPDWVKNYNVPMEWMQVESAQLGHAHIDLCVLAVEHYRFVAATLNAIEHKSPALFPHDCHDHNRCGLGQWLIGEGEKLYGELVEFKKIAEEHKKVHKMSDGIKTLMAESKLNNIDEIKRDLFKYRDNVLANLKKLQ